jgi:hypothetical protein
MSNLKELTDEQLRAKIKKIKKLAEEDSSKKKTLKKLLAEKKSRGSKDKSNTKDKSEKTKKGKSEKTTSKKDSKSKKEQKNDKKKTSGNKSKIKFRYTYIGYFFYVLGAIDFLVSWIGIDLTGIYISPYLFGVMGYSLCFLDKRSFIPIDGNENLVLDRIFGSVKGEDGKFQSGYLTVTTEEIKFYHDEKDCDFIIPIGNIESIERNKKIAFKLHMDDEEIHELSNYKPSLFHEKLTSLIEGEDVDTLSKENIEKADKKSKIILHATAGFYGVLTIIFLFFTSSNSGYSDYVDTVKTGSFNAKPNITIEEYLGKSLSSMKWEGIVADDGESYVNVSGTLKPEVLIQFKISENGEEFEVNAVEMGEKPLNILQFFEFIDGDE